MTTYEILNPPAFTKKSRHGKFIYVLMFNIADMKTLPYYVGQTSGLTARFGGHPMIMWHLAKFDAPPKIWIAGEVKAARADAAEQDLITNLSNAGYLLTNSSIDMSWAKRFQRQRGLFHLTAAQVRDHLSRDSPRTTVLVAWKRKWQAEPPKYAAAGSALTRDQVVDYVSKLTYDSPSVRDVSLAIARHHDSDLGYSRVVFKDAMRGIPGVGKVYNHARKLTWLWYFNRAILPDQLHDFRLTAKHLDELRSHVQEETAR
ncbi:hypothetical protein [Arthrobacter sp. B1I2]|uniref:hypothetical protein n=1 Tax=Arthrobacter sp. B1I2 TaxID=3042263 RepID=UPI002786DFA8|nr:hypothetical protein [Arthrobacter sp. B1I2]MDQ0733522.1 hypothetical protein [Arthrobacter sp. B1I2]